MAKRFTDTEKWADPWFTGMPLKMRLAWCYICDKCDGAGVWKVHLSLMSFFVGDQISLDEFKHHFEKRIIWLNEEKIWIKGFIPFQYGALSPNNRAHRGIMKKLLHDTRGLPVNDETRELLDSFERVIKGSNEGQSTLQVKEKEEEEDKSKVKVKDQDNASLKTEIRFRFAKEIQEIENLLETLYNGPVPKSIKSNIPAMLIACSGDLGKVHRVLEDLYQSPKISSGQGLTGSRSAYVTAALREAFDLGGGAA